MKTIPLSRQYVIGSTVLSQIGFREPLVKDLRRIGNPVDAQQGMVFVDKDLIWAYADTLLDQSVPPGMINELDLVDGIAIQRGILGFFTAAVEQLAKVESSSSASAGDQQTSPS